jgi:hypothetical protein
MVEPHRIEYAAAGFVKVDDILPADVLSALAVDLVPVLSVIAENVQMRHAPTEQQTLSDGARFRRVDPHCVREAVTRKKLVDLLDSLGLVRFGAQLGAALTPLVKQIVGPVEFERVYFYLYGEGDYISVHDDHHVGNRFDVQFPVSLGTVGGLRVLADGFLRIHYDRPGSMNVLGPCVWHDVPPLLRSASGVDPQRVNIGMRFTPEA